MDVVKVKELVQKRNTYEEIAEFLKSKNPNARGISSRSVRRFCCANRINKKSLFGNEALDLMLEKEVSQVCTNNICLFGFYFI